MSIRRGGLLVACLLLQVLGACGDAGPRELRLNGMAMGTSYSVTVVAGAELDLDALGAELRTTLDDADRRMSTYREDSELARFNRSQSTDWQAVSPELCEVVHLSLEIGKLTSGAFDITVGPVVDLWGFGPGDTVTTPPSAVEIGQALETTGLDHVEADCGKPALRKSLPRLRVDLSGIGKGQAARDIGWLLNERGIFDFLVEVGGDLAAQGAKANGEQWSIAIEVPNSQGRAVQRIIRIDGNSVATSGDYRNFFEYEGRRYSHTIDPRTGRPVTHDLASVTVVFDNGPIADAYATAMLVLGPDAGLALAERLSIPAYFLVRDGDTLVSRASSAFEARFGA